MTQRRQYETVLDYVPPLEVGQGLSTVRPHFPGLIIRHDVRNENYLHPAARAAVRGAAPFKPRTVHHRQYRRYDQGAQPSCTGFSMVTYLATAHPYNKPPLTGEQWYAFNRAEDQRNGLFFAGGGATTIASMQVGRQLGLLERYEWIFTLEGMHQAILERPLIVGTDWYPSMWERDAEGIVQAPKDGEVSAGGHQYELNGYDARRGLWRYPSTWGDGDYLIPDEVMYDLLRDGGECSVPYELVLPKDWELPEVPELR